MPEPPDGGAAVELVDVVVRYGATVALAGVDLVAPRGTVTALLGPNGAGKTTTVEACEGFRRPASGRLRVLGLDPWRHGRALRPRVGVMLQSGGIPTAARPREVLQLVAALHAHPLDADQLVERLGLGPALGTPYRALSGGQRQLLALGLAVVGRPELVFLDEPTAGLDPQARRATWELVGELRDAGVSVVLTTHYLEEAERLAGLVHILDRGRVVASGSPAELVAGQAAGEPAALSFSGPPGLDLRGLQAALPSGRTAAEVAPGRYLVRGPVGPQELAGVTAWCAGQGFLPEELGVHRPTLEDVFLALTGRELRG